jgi:hypothetical protein
MSKRKFSVINYIESEECSYNKGQTSGESLANEIKRDPTFNFKSYLDGLCNGYTLEFKSIKESSEERSNDCSFEINPSINLLTYINHEKISYNKGVKDGRTLAKNTGIQFINFKCYLEGLCDSYTNYDITIPKSKSFTIFGFNFEHADCVTRSTNETLENIVDKKEDNDIRWNRYTN